MSNKPKLRCWGTFATRLLLVLGLLILPTVAEASDWRLELQKVENVTNPAGGGNVQTGQHGELFCQAPPAVINKGDKVEMQVSDKGNIRVYLAFNVNYYNKKSQVYDDLWGYITFADLYGNGFTKDIDPGPRTFSHTFGETFLEDFKDDKKEARNNAEFAIIFQTQYGETRWIYKYYGDGGDAAAVEEEVEEEEADSPKVVVAVVDGISDDKFIVIIFGTGVAYAFALLAGLLNANNQIPPEDTPGGNVPTGPRRSDPYVYRQKDGSLVYTNPISHETEYLPPDADEEFIRNHVEHLLDNRAYYERIQNQHNRWTQEQRSQLQDEIRRREGERERYLERKAQEEAAQKKRDDYVDRLKDKYMRLDDLEGDPNKSLRKDMISERDTADADKWNHLADEHYIEMEYEGVKLVKDWADVSEDFLAEVGGEGAKTFRDVYRATAEISQTLVDAKVRGKDMKRAAVVGTVRAGITVWQYRTEGGWHAASTIGGEGARDFTTALYEGKSWKEAWDAAKNGAKRGAKDQAVDWATGKMGDKVGGKVKSDYGQKMTKGIGAIGDDVGKMQGDKWMGN